MTRLIFFCLGLLITSCASSPKSGHEIGAHLTQNEYKRLIASNTRHAVKYEGFYNQYEVYATYMNSEVQATILQKRSDVLRWDESTAQKERERMFQENSTSTKFTVSLFVPSPRLNDLHKGNSIWRIYLEAGGQRYTGRATRRNEKLEELVEMFPHHNRWSTAYEVVFPVPLSAIHSGPVTLILTSTQGTAILEYPAVVSAGLKDYQ